LGQLLWLGKDRIKRWDAILQFRGEEAFTFDRRNREALMSIQRSRQATLSVPRDGPWSGPVLVDIAYVVYQGPRRLPFYRGFGIEDL